MSTEYWGQWDHSELMSMQGIDMDCSGENEGDFDCDEDEITPEENRCPRCAGGGCNYCLMLEW